MRRHRRPSKLHAERPRPVDPPAGRQPPHRAASRASPTSSTAWSRVSRTTRSQARQPPTCCQSSAFGPAGIVPEVQVVVPRRRPPPPPPAAPAASPTRDRRTPAGRARRRADRSAASPRAARRVRGRCTPGAARPGLTRASLCNRSQFRASRVATATVATIGRTSMRTPDRHRLPRALLAARACGRSADHPRRDRRPRRRRGRHRGRRPGRRHRRRRGRRRDRRRRDRAGD